MCRRCKNWVPFYGAILKLRRCKSPTWKRKKDLRSLVMSNEEQRRHKPFHEAISVQGLQQVCGPNSNIVRRGVWFFIFCCGLGFTAFNIYNQITLYLSTPVNVRVDKISAQRLPFPAISVCNNNYMRKSAVGELESVLKFIYPYTDFDETVTEADLSLADTTEISIEAIMTMFHSVNTSILKCEWESRSCGLDQFSHKFTDMGLCYSFNLDGSRFARNSGRAYGLRVVLNVQEEEYIRSLSGHIGIGFMVAVHAPEVPPIMSEMGIAVAPGFQHFMGVEVKKQTAKEGISGCGLKKLQHTLGNYSREACRLECQGNFITKICNCKDFSIPNNVSICRPQKFHGCFLPTLDKYLQEGTGCEAECPEQCSYTSFNTRHSSSPLSRDYITEYTKAEGQTEDYWRRNLVILEVYLSSMAYEHIEKQLGYEILDLFCDIGGAMGLLLGASILTVLEVLDFMCIRSFSKIFRTNRVQEIDIKPGK